MGCSQLQSTTASNGQWRLRRLIQLTGRYPPTFTGQLTPQLHLHSANADYKSQYLLPPVGRELASFGMTGQRTAYAATQGILKFKFIPSMSCVVFKLVKFKHYC